VCHLENVSEPFGRITFTWKTTESVCTCITAVVGFPSQTTSAWRASRCVSSRDTFPGQHHFRHGPGEWQLLHQRVGWQVRQRSGVDILVVSCGLWHREAVRCVRLLILDRTSRRSWPDWSCTRLQDSLSPIPCQHLQATSAPAPRCLWRSLHLNSMVQHN